MFLLDFIRYLRGYVWFEARGVFVERFLNLVARDRIAVWAGSKRGEIYRGCVAARDYRRLRAHAKKTGVKLRHTAKKGTPFQRRKFRKRTGLLVGLGIFLTFLVGMSQFVWRIEIRGNQDIDEMAILQALEKLEVSPGVPRGSIDIRDCERRMLLLIPDLSWVALNLDGSALRVEVNESVQPPAMVDPKAPCNIVAKEAGQIVSMNVFEGQALVREGDTVLPGDIIVSGITQDGRGQSLFRHARAQVFAETVQVLEASVPLQQTEYRETGRVMKRGYLDVFGIELPVFLPWRIPSPYRVERSEAPVAVFGLELPLGWLSEQYILMEEVPVTLTEDEAKQEALQELSNLQKARLGDAEILEKTAAGALRDDRFSIRAEYLCSMDIAMEKEIFLAAEPEPAAPSP